MMKAVVLTRGARWYYGITALGFLCGITLLFTAFYEAGKHIAVVSLTLAMTFAWARGHLTRR